MYESFYNLSRRPFQLMPDPRFLFPSKGHQRALSYLWYGLDQREGFVVITGDVGTGKTLLIQSLTSELSDRDVSIAQVAMANLDADGVLPMVASAFGLQYESRSKVALLNDLANEILPAYSRGALLVVDEAQTCTPGALEELRIISNLQVEGRALLQIFLVGQTDLRATLADPSMSQLRQRMIASHHLQPLKADEVRQYVRHRMAAVDWNGDPEFEDDIYDKVHEWSGGVPRRINLLMDRLLLYGYLEERHRLSVKDLETVAEEFDAEITEMPEQWGKAAIPTGTGASNEHQEELDARVSALERALTARLGTSAANRLLHQYDDIAGGEPASLEQRIARLEKLAEAPVAQEPAAAAQQRQEWRARWNDSRSAAATHEQIPPGRDKPRWGRFGWRKDED